MVLLSLSVFDVGDVSVIYFIWSYNLILFSTYKGPRLAKLSKNSSGATELIILVDGFISLSD